MVPAEAGAAMIDTALLVVLLLQLKHFVFDFVTQTQYQLRNKGIYGHPGGLIHATYHAVGSAVVLVPMRFAALLPAPLTLIVALLAVEFAIHYHVDWGKEQIVKSLVESQGPLYWAVFGFDQFLHQATYVAMAYFIFHP
jgi:hypothetical protein